MIDGGGTQTIRTGDAPGKITIKSDSEVNVDIPCAIEFK